MLSIENLTYRIAGREILSRASAHLPARRRVGLVGRNGAGKSTLLRLISGEATPDAGELLVPSAWRVGTVAQEAPSGETALIDTVLAADRERLALLEEAETQCDHVRLGEIHGRLEAVEAWAAPARAASILAGLGFSESEQQRPCSQFSGGWRMRVALAAILFAAPDLLLLDEPTNYLDLEGVLWLEDYLRRYRGTVIIVSHDRDLLNSVAEFILHLEHGRLALYSGNYETFVEVCEAQRELDEATRKKQDTARQRMQDFVDRFRYKQSKARQAQSRLKMIARLKPIEILLDESVAPIRLPAPTPAAPPLIALEKAAVGYQPDRPILTNVSLRLDPDDRVALLGQNGNGKSTLAKLLAGKLSHAAGEVVRSRKLVPGYFAQHQIEELDATLTALETLARLRPRLSELELRTRLGSAGLSGDKALTRVDSLSGGERSRLMLVLAMLDSPNLLILDEPTNHLDIDAREQLLEALNNFEGAVVLVSHDRRLIDATADRLLLVAEGTVREFDGDLEDYRRQILSPPKQASGDGEKPQRQNNRREAAARRLQLKPLKDEVLNAEREIMRLTQEIATLDSALSLPDAYKRDPANASRLAQRRAKLAHDLASAETRWLTASETLENAGTKF